MAKTDYPQSPTTKTDDDQLIDITPLSGLDDLVFVELPNIESPATAPKWDSFTEFWCWLRGTTPAYRSTGSV